MRKINSTMVARVAGVSQATVSKVVNNSGKIAPETREAVIRAAHRLGYAMIPRKSRITVAVVIPATSFEGYIGSMLSTLTAEIFGHGMRQELIPESDLSILAERCVAGGIALGWDRKLNRAWNRIHPAAPLIRINGPSDHVRQCHGIAFDGARSLDEMVGHLWDQGHRDIGFCLFDNRQHERDNISGRYRGFRQALLRRRVASPDRFVTFSFSSYPVERRCEILSEWMRQGMTALISSNEARNMYIDQALRRLGVKVPDELSWVGWENSHVTSFLTPPLTTLGADRREICRRAIDLLLHCLDGGVVTEDIRIPYMITHRDSVGPARRPCRAAFAEEDAFGGP